MAEAAEILGGGEIAAARPGLFARFEDILERLGDRLNPILVKETRQALKSRQFVITFVLLLVCAWLWTLYAVAVAGPEIYYGVQGPDLFMGYYFVLALPMFVIVPFGAYRSVVVEQEDRTWSLLAISALKPRQIILGKLGSSFLQMLIYLSSLAPCLVFTYMLRGIDVVSIVSILGYTVMASLGFSMLALLAGTLTWERHWQVVLSVLMILGLFLVTWCAMMIASALLMYGGFTNWEEFGIAHGVLASAYLSYFALALFAAMGQISFATDNRATRLRAVMLVQFLLLAGWFAGALFGSGGFQGEPFVAAFIMAGIHWGVMGALMNGENPRLSRRVKRSLPQSFLGRAFLTWFNPGPGTGYVFAVCGMGAAVLVGVIGLVACDVYRPRTTSFYSHVSLEKAAMVGVLAFLYVVFYLGMGQTLIRFLRRWTPTPIVLAFLLQIVLLMAGSFAPWAIQMATPSLRTEEYTLLQATNPFWTLYHAADHGTIDEMIPVACLLALAAGAFFTLNLPAIAREVAETRIAAPQRVQEEDDAAEAAKRPPVPTRLSPWD